MSKDLVVVNGKQRKLRFNEVVLADGSVGKVKPGLLASDLQLSTSVSADDFYRPVVPASVWGRVHEITSRKTKSFVASWFGSTAVVTVGASVSAGLAWGVGAGLAFVYVCSVLGFGVHALVERLLYTSDASEQQRFMKSLQGANVSAFVAWVESRYGLVMNVDDYDFEELARLASLDVPSSHATFTHETEVYRVRVSERGTYLTPEVDGELTQIGVASQADSVKDLFPDEGKLLWVALQRRLKVLEGQDLVLEAAHVLRRVKQDAAELVSSLQKLKGLESASDAEVGLVVDILDGLNAEVQGLIDAQESVVLNGLRGQAEWVKSRKLIGEGSHGLLLGSEVVDAVAVAVESSHASSLVDSVETTKSEA